MSVKTAVTEAEIWDRAICPKVGDLSAAAARSLLRLRISDADSKRVQELSTKADEGTLSELEAKEFDNYLNFGRALEFIKAKARRSLKAA